jgi:hypothetical protein
MDVETFLGEDVLHGLNAEAMLDRTVELLFRLVWTNHQPWTVPALRAATEQLQAAHAALDPPRDIRIGQIGNANYEMHQLHDPLAPGVANVIADVADPHHPFGADDDVGAEQRRFATELLRRRFPGHHRNA